jgi:hypothetical protein
MNYFSDPSTAAKYDRLGFLPEGLLLILRIGNVSISAAEHPWKGVVLLFQSFTSRRMSQFDVSLPTKCTVEQVAGLIYINIAHNFSDSKDACKSYFESRRIHMFQ